MKTPIPDVNSLLKAWSGGDRSALDRLMPIPYEDLLAIAKRRMWQKRFDHTLEPTALVNEAYLRLDLRRTRLCDHAFLRQYHPS